MMNDPTSQKELLSEWKGYFSTLLILNIPSKIATASPPPAESDLPIDTNPPTLDETKKAIKSLKRNKALDSGIMPETLVFFKVTSSLHSCS